MSVDTPRIRFLQAQYAAAMQMNKESDMVAIHPLPDSDPPERYVVELRSRGLAGTSPADIRESDYCAVGIWFHEDYLRFAEPLRAITWLAPANQWHPNLAPPAACLGPIRPATRLIQLVYSLHEIVVYANYGTDERDCLNRDACRWARANAHLFPLDTRPLKRPGSGTPQGTEGAR